MTREETLQMLRSKRQTKTHLTDAQKKELIEKLALPATTVTAVAHAYNVSRQTVYNLIAEYEEAENEDKTGTC